MSTQVSWLNEADKILIATTIGMWKPDELLKQFTFALSLKPDYLIWDPTEMIFSSEQQNSYQDSSPSRQRLMDGVTNALKARDLNLLFIVRKVEHPSFDRLGEQYAEQNIEHLMYFISSVEDIYEIIASHQP